MSDIDSAIRKARARAETAERDLSITERDAAAARERAQRAKLTLKKAKKEYKKASKAARKARKAADAASTAFVKATARVTRAEALVSTARTTRKKRVAVATATRSGPTKALPKKKTAALTDDVATSATPRTVRKRVRRAAVTRSRKRSADVFPAPVVAPEPAIAAAEPNL